MGNLLWWLALPPLSLGPLAWLAPLPWVVLIRRAQLPGKRPYLSLWLSSFVFWLATVYWLTLPHWATSAGWLALSFYLAFYLPAFVALSRVGVHNLHMPSFVAAPVVWTGFEFCRAHVFGGFTMASLSHTQTRWPELLQISDVFGAYGVSFVIVLVAACLAEMLPCDGQRRKWWPLAPAAVVLAGVLGYGHWRVTQDALTPGPKVALVQGSIDIEMKYDPKQGQRIFDEYFELSQKAVAEHADLDLIVWPETMFRYPWFTFDQKFTAPPEATWTPADAEAGSRRAVESTVSRLHAPFLLGIETVHESPDRTRRYNSALFTDASGHALGRYDKYHLVPFGEYVWFAETFPWLYNLTPLQGGLSQGAGPLSVKVENVRYSANICYEDTIGHLIRSQVAQLRESGEEPDVLVNLTNDGWFWGSTELDLHLACAVFRAIECRKPFLIAANTGFSAWIDSNGRVLTQGRRRDTDLIIADTQIDHRHSWYVEHGDVTGVACLTACGVLTIVGLRSRRRATGKPSLKTA